MHIIKKVKLKNAAARLKAACGGAVKEGEQYELAEIHTEIFRSDSDGAV